MDSWFVFRLIWRPLPQNKRRIANYLNNHQDQFDLSRYRTWMKTTHDVDEFVFIKTDDNDSIHMMLWQIFLSQETIAIVKHASWKSQGSFLDHLGMNTLNLVWRLIVSLNGSLIRIVHGRYLRASVHNIVTYYCVSSCWSPQFWSVFDLCVSIRRETCSYYILM